jgi:transposase
MRHCGLDVHTKRTTVVCIDDETGEMSRASSLSNDELVAHLQSLDQPLQVIMETGSTSAFLKRQFDTCQIRAIVVNAHKAFRLLEAINSQAKTDKVDAKGLALLSAKGWAEEIAIWVADAPTQRLRVLTRTREERSKLSNMVRNGIRAKLRSEGLLCAATNLTGPTAAVWLDEAETHLNPCSRDMVRQDRRLLAQIMEQIAVIDVLLEEVVAEDVRCQQLDTIAGCGLVTASAVVAEIGDITRFADAKALRRYAGLTPKIEQSGERTTTGKLVGHCNKHLRRALITIAQCFVKSDRIAGTRMKKHYYQCVFRHGPNPAKVDLARRLCDVIFAMLRDGTNFDPGRLATA